ncbi:MAG: hypothetical protein ABH829_02640 [archaeon]
MFTDCPYCKNRMHLEERTYFGNDSTFQNAAIKYYCWFCVSNYSYEPETGFRKLED